MVGMVSRRLLLPTSSLLGLVWWLQRTTLQRAVSAHAAVLVIRRLESMQSHANSRQAGSSCIVCLRLGQRQARPGGAGPGQAWSCTGHAVTLLLREEREREKRAR